MVVARLAGLFVRGLHADSRTVVDRPLYGWFQVEGTLDDHGILRVEKIEDFPQGANPSRWARAEGVPTKKLYDDGYSLALELLFGSFPAYVWDKPLIARILEQDGPLYVEGPLYDGRIYRVAYAGSIQGRQGTPAVGQNALALGPSRG